METSDQLYIIINGQEHWVEPEYITLNLSRYLREVLFLTGTKIVCSEGDCGACTVLVKYPLEPVPKFKPINSCVATMFALSGTHVLTVESFQSGKKLSEVQEKMVNHGGSQCGFCTPGIVSSLAAVVEEKGAPLSERQVKNALTGNLCRCTGYKAIIAAGVDIVDSRAGALTERYETSALIASQSLEIKQSKIYRWKGVEIFAPVTLKEALDFKSKHPEARIYSGGTDLGVLLNKGYLSLKRVISLNGIAELYKYNFSDGVIQVSAKVAFSELQVLLEKESPDFAKLINIFASPQIKNVGTLVGNIANGSPIGDTLPFLFIMEAKLKLENSSSSRVVPISDFYKGYKEFDLKPDEIITSVTFKIDSKKVYRFYKASQRRDLDISCVSFAGRSTLKADGRRSVMMALGGVAGTVIRLPRTEAYLNKGEWSQPLIDKAISEAKTEISPMSDVRGSAEFRTLLVSNMIRKFVSEVEAQK